MRVFRDLSDESVIWNDLLHGELELAGNNAGPGAWAEAAGLAVGGGIRLSSIITHRIPAAHLK